MNKKITLGIPFFVVLGAFNGIMISLPGAFFMDVLVASYTVSFSFSYIDWVVVLAPVFALVGALFNLCSAILLYEEPKKKRFLFWEWS